MVVLLWFHARYKVLLTYTKNYQERNVQQK